MKSIFIFLFLVLSNFLFSQISYSGFIDKYPIELVTDIYSDGQGSAIYAYSNVDTPIVLNGELKENVLVFTEKNQDKQNAKLTFKNYDSQSGQLKGIWKDLNSGKELEISLKKEFDINSNPEQAEKEILQPSSLKKQLF